MTLSITVNETSKMALIAAHLNAGHSGGDSVAIGIYYSPSPPYHHHPPPLLSPSLISLVVSVDVKHHVYLLTKKRHRYIYIAETVSKAVTLGNL